MALPAIAVHPSSATLRTPTLPFGDVSPEVVGPELAQAGTAVVPAAFLFAWMSLGVAAACVLGRRGHDFRGFAGLGLALGPLMIPLGVDAVRRRERWPGGILVAHGRPGRGQLDVLVGVVGGAESAEAAGRLVELLGSRVGRLALARVIDYESAEEEGWNDVKVSAAVELELASSFVVGQQPDLVLLAGPASKAFVRYAAEAGYAVVLLTGRPRRRLRGGEPQPELAVVPISSGGKGSG